MIEVQKYLQGQVVDGRYPLIEFLGATQHSSVFRTQCEGAPNQVAAIKIIPSPAGTSGAQLTRWRLAARFSHPALLRIFDMGRCEFEGRPMLYVVMECAEENLADILPARCLSPGETDALLGPALDALGYLHGKGFVHGHLRPSNILAIGDQVKFSSDSIARIGEAADLRDPRDPYAAPEISLSAATDIWSLGVTLIECLTGRVPDRSAEGRHSVSIPTNVPAPFLDLARHCLNPIPQRRWSLAQLRAALIPGSAVVAPAPPPEPARDSASASSDLARSAFVKPEAVAPVRRRFRLKKQHRLALAALAAATAAFVFGIVISANSTDTTVTASAPIAQSHTGAAAEKNVRASALLKPSSNENTDVAKDSHNFSARPLLRMSRKASPRDEKSSRTEFARADNSGPAVTISKVAPSALAQPSSPVSGDVAQGAVARRALPRVPVSASNTIWGTVRVSVVVDVDPRGRVVEAKLDSRGPSKYFARLSMAAAPDWKFTPPRVSGQIVPSEWVINFGYSKSDTSASATERHP
ncbi:MAG: serine/threonine-protein kinase [Candidatus Acidiferrales bacterium]